MTDASYEQVVEERQFAGVLQTQAGVFFRLSNVLLKGSQTRWSRKHYFQLINESDSLESFLDDYGARYNRQYSFFTELVASTRWFAQAGYSMTHLLGRLDSYGSEGWFVPAERELASDSLRRTLQFVRRSTASLVETALAEATKLGLEITPELFPEKNFLPVVARQRLPHNVGQDELDDEEQKIAEVASRFIQASEMLRDARVRRIEDSGERRAYLARICTEEQARVYEATVHNLQSAYDTHVKNTVLEANDPRLRRLRGHASVTLHLLETVTFLTHFYERHESDVRAEAASRIEALIPRDEVQDMILNHLLYWADRLLDAGSKVAEELLPSYTNVQELDVELDDDLVLHARPAALIVGIVNRYGTPVEMEVAGQTCNAGSILELLVTVGTHPDEKRFVFRGDENPLRDIAILFRFALGERGTEGLPGELGYLSD